jgi:hypothetical protein
MLSYNLFSKPNFIIHWNNLFYIDHNTPFGATSSVGIFSKVTDTMSAILTSKAFGPSKNWVDDFVFFRFSISTYLYSFSYSLSDIYDVALRLGWPWKESKTHPFASHFKYVSFVWDYLPKLSKFPTPSNSIIY